MCSRRFKTKGTQFTCFPDTKVQNLTQKTALSGWAGRLLLTKRRRTLERRLARKFLRKVSYYIYIYIYTERERERETRERERREREKEEREGTRGGVGGEGGGQGGDREREKGRELWHARAHASIYCLFKRMSLI